MPPSEDTNNETNPKPPPSTQSRHRPPSTATVISKAIQDFESDFQIWDSIYKLQPLPPTTSRPYTPHPYSIRPTYPFLSSHTAPSITISHRSSVDSLHSDILSEEEEEEEGEVVLSKDEEDCRVLQGRVREVYSYNPRFEKGTTFPRRMSRFAIVGDSSVCGSSGTLVSSGTATYSGKVEGGEEEEIGYLARVRRDILRRGRVKKEKEEG
ncbi:hypothetical protein TWF281_011371 [Arthrobotrys megalospora]